MPTLDLNNTFGALFLGVVISSILYGMTCIQTWYYLLNYNDNRLVKYSVIILFILETIHSAFGIHAVYYFVITNYDNPVGLLKSTWTATFTLAVTSVIMLIVQLFYAKRVYHVCRKNTILTGALLLLAVAHFGTGISVTIKAMQLQYFALFVESTGIMDAALALAAVTDVLAAASLSLYLHRSRTGIRSTDTLINKLMVYTINNGILTSAVDILTLIFATVEGHNLIFLCIFQVVGNLYTNSMLATLNSRKTTAEDLQVLPTSGLQLSGASSHTFRAARPMNGTEGTIDNDMLKSYQADSSNIDDDKQLESSMVFKVVKSTTTDIANR